MQSPLDHYINRFRKLHVSRNRTHGPAPHKPILLLAIIEGIEEGRIRNNRIYITPWLVSAFKSNWSALVDSPHYRPDFTLPFYFMRSEPFWRLRTLPGREIILTTSSTPRSFSSLKASVDHAEIDEALFMLLNHPASRHRLRAELLQYWFGRTDTNPVQYEEVGLFALEQRILNEPNGLYIPVKDEEEDFVRDGAFKDAVLNSYNLTCAISGLRVVTTDNTQMLDACHIEPWRISHNDSIHNGFALCPNLHRAFDRHLLYIDDEYRVQIRADRFNESSGEAYGILQFQGKELILPRERKYWPDVENFRRHRGIINN